jgi:Zn-dependent protease
MFHDISLFDGAAWYVAFLFSTTVHEASHALAALRLGDDTAHRGGQVTLDPIPHIQREPIGMVAVPIISYLMGGWMVGWASAPYDPRWANRYPKRAALMAIAGPASNLLLVIAAAIAIRLGIVFGFFQAPMFVSSTQMVAGHSEGITQTIATLLSIFFSLNLLLFAFNLIPLPPLDGSAIPLLFLSDAASEKYSEFMQSPGMRMMGLVIAWQLFGRVYPSVQNVAIRLLYPEWHYAASSFLS